MLSFVSYLTVAFFFVSFQGLAKQIWLSVPDPYMDEVFHVPQTQEYCEGNFGAWDPSITTLPGLYWIGVVYSKMISLFADLTGGQLVSYPVVSCGVEQLREVNILLAAGCLMVLMSHFEARNMSGSKALAHAMCLVLYPVHLFSCLLFYTDPASTFFVLLASRLLLPITPKPPRVRKKKREKKGSSEKKTKGEEGEVGKGERTRDGASKQQQEQQQRGSAPSTAQKKEPGQHSGGGGDEGTGADQGSAAAAAAAPKATPPGIGKVWAAAVSCCAAILCRQNNIIWVLFFTGTSMLDHLQSMDKEFLEASTRPEPLSPKLVWHFLSLALSGRPPNTGAASSAGVRSETGSSGGSKSSKGRTGGGGGGGGGADGPKNKRNSKRGDKNSPQTATGSTGVAVVRAGGRSVRGELVARLYPMLLPLLGFCAFLAWNRGSLVLGHQEHHQPVPHFAQVGHFFGVAASLWGVVGPASVLAPGTLAACDRWCKKWCFRSLLSTSVAVGALACAVALMHSYSFVHPFLLSDNRHYTFYVWRRLLDNPSLPWMRAFLALPYTFAAHMCLLRLSQVKNSIWVLIYVVATCLVLVPAHLLEPRYFTVPIFLLHQSVPERSWGSLSFWYIGSVVVNAGVILTFLNATFTYADGTVARFIW